ncbi:MAG: acetylxylan esterase, partial [Saprospiraceae bacterium]
MNKQHLLVRFSACFFALFNILPLYAQLEVSVNQSDAIYEVGEIAYFQAKAIYSSPATYEIIYDEQSPVIETGTINLVAGQNYSIPYRQDEPGVAICRVNLNNVIREASAVFSPLDISPLEEEPNDFDAFWASQKNLKNSLPMDMQMSYHNESSYQTTYTFSLANIEGRRTYGYISVPKGNGPFPASITLPPYGTSSSVVGADRESAEKGGMIAVSISIHNRPVNQDDPNAYKPDDNTDREKFYYRYGLIGAMHVIDYLETRSDFDGNVCAMGVSQGGGLSILLAGIDDRISLLINSNPTMGQHVGYKYDRASGFPSYLSIIDDRNQGNSSVFNSAVNATKYYDAMFHARRFKGASFSLTGLKDLVVPSATALVSHNQLRGSKVLMISRDGGHNHPNEYWNGRFEFMRRHFEGANSPPFQFGAINKGFLANAGNDQTVGTSANLNGEIFYDNNQLNNLPVSWRKVSGPGNVSFSNANGYKTSANFSSNGTYVLQFVSRDDRKLANEGKVYYISDDVTVTVTGGSNPTFTLNLSCPSNQSVEIPAGQSQTNVSWNDPNVTSNCSGGASAFQLTGPANGSAFFAGNYTISYNATDNCGNSEDCSFSINVTQAATQPTDIDLNCPSDIIVDAAPGDNEVTVSWANPTATSTCSTGGNTGSGDCSSTFKSGYAYMGTFDNSQFYISNNDANWIDANAAAISEGGRLAIINDAAENDFIQENINNEIVFIGLSDIDQEGNLRWVDGSAVGYNKYVGNLNNNNNNDFVTIYPWNGEWDLNNQYVTKKYVIEIPCSNGGGSNDSV